MSASIDWEPLGKFLLAPSPDGKELWAKLPFFDAGFRDYARTQRAKWSDLEKAWRFPAKRKEEVIAALSAMAASIQEAADAKASRAEQAEREAIDRMAREPLVFESPQLSLRYDESERCVWASYPFGAPWGLDLYRAGARFDRERKSHRVPLRALDILLSATQQERDAHALFAALNAPWLDREREDPLVAPTPSRDGVLALKIQALPEKLQYEIELPFATGSELGFQARAALEKAGCFEVFKLCAGRAMRCEMRHRETAQKALAILGEVLEGLGPKTKTAIPIDRLAGRSWSRRDAPDPGDLFFEKQRAWVISASRKQREILILDVHRVDHQTARDIVESRRPGLGRTCSMSELSMAQLPAALDALELFEASEAVEARPVSAGRASRL